MEGFLASVYGCNVWVLFVAVSLEIAFLFRAHGVFASIPDVKLNSAARKESLKASKFLVVKDTLQSFMESRGLQNETMAWRRDCKPECYQNNGTCNLLNGTCLCPMGRVHSDAGMLCSQMLCSSEPTYRYPHVCEPLQRPEAQPEQHARDSNFVDPRIDIHTTSACGQDPPSGMSCRFHCSTQTAAVYWQCFTGVY